MYNQLVSGGHSRCPIPTCRTPFHRDCHLGYLPKSEMEVFAVMQCPKCKYRFAISQMIGMAHHYYERLPIKPKEKIAPTRHITKSEVERFRKKMDTDANPLASLFDPPVRPGASIYPASEE